MQAEDPRLQDAQARPIGQIVEMLAIDGLTLMGREMTGPCPQCGGKDRFSVNADKGVFLCRQCGAKGDGIGLVRFVLGLSFPDALTWLCGDRHEITPEEHRARAERAEASRRKSEAEGARRRADAIAQARRIWAEGKPAEGSPVRDYLALRGITRALLPDLPACLRYHPDLPYMIQTDGAWVQAHRGPAMLAAIQAPDGTGTAVHRTWFDLTQPRGKARIVDGAGQPLKVKKGWGSKKGAAIRLHAPGDDWDTLVMAEGIETTLTALVARVWDGAAFWAGIDLGNIAGRMQSGPGLRHAGLPDLGDHDAFVPPPWVRHLILIEDGDSDPKSTRAKLLAGARRAMALRPGLSARVVPCPPGLDLNDVLLAGAGCTPPDDPAAPPCPA